MTRYKNHRYHALDSLRGVCACLVVLYHFNVASPIAQWPFVRMSWLFVDFFFVLSGFVIAASYRGRLTTGYPLHTFMLLRLGRIYPLHLFMLLAFVAVEFATMAAHIKLNHTPFTGSHSPAAIASNLVLLQGFGAGPTWNYPAWSISVEMWAYLLFAVVARLAGPALAAWLIGAAVAAALILLVVTGTIDHDHNWAMLRCVYGFAIGALAYAALRTGPGGVPDWRWSALEAGTAATIFAFVALAGPTPWNLLAPPLFGAAVLVFARERGILSRILVTAPALLLGQLSYSIYMTHALVLIVAGVALKQLGAQFHVPLTSIGPGPDGSAATLAGATALQGTIFVLITLGIVVAVSWLTYHLIERPGQRWSRRLAGSATPA